MKLYLVSEYFTGHGRMGRWEYTKRLMVVFGAIIVLLAAMWLSKSIHENISKLFVVVLLLAPRVCLICLYVRRLHDLNRSGWWVLPLGIFQLDLLLLMPILTLWPGTKGPNNHGPQPTKWNPRLILAILIDISQSPAGQSAEWLRNIIADEPAVSFGSCYSRLTRSTKWVNHQIIIFHNAF